MSLTMKVCAWSLCRKVIPRGRRFCSRHEWMHRAGRQDRWIEYVYDSRRWRNKTRPVVLERDQCCVFCSSELGLQVAHVARTQEMLAAGLDVYEPAFCVAACSAHNAAAAELVDVDELASLVRGGGLDAVRAVVSARARGSRESSTTVAARGNR
jgi:hypothetical protein